MIILILILISDDILEDTRIEIYIGTQLVILYIQYHQQPYIQVPIHQIILLATTSTYTTLSYFNSKYIASTSIFMTPTTSPFTSASVLASTSASNPLPSTSASTPSASTSAVLHQHLLH